MIIFTLVKNCKYLILIKQIRSSFSVTFVIYQKRNQFLSVLYYYHYHYQYYYYHYCYITVIIIIIIIIISMNTILLHYYLRAGVLVKDTAILMASVVRPLRREYYVAASSPKLRCQPVGDVNFKRFAIASNRSGKTLVLNKICSFITLWCKSPNLSVFVLFTSCRS